MNALLFIITVLVIVSSIALMLTIAVAIKDEIHCRSRVCPVMLAFASLLLFGVSFLLLIAAAFFEAI